MQKKERNGHHSIEIQAEQNQFVEKTDSDGPNLGKNLEIIYNNLC